MASAFGLWQARRLAKYGIEWYNAVSHDVWILTDCHQRRVYALENEVYHWWNLIKEAFHDNCDFMYPEKYCRRQHSLIRGHDEIPVASFRERLHEDMLKDPEGFALWGAESQVKREAAISDLPPFALVPSLRPTPGVVYVIWAEDTHRMKIGRSTSAQLRLDTFQTASPYPLRLLREIPTQDTVALEAALHRRYAKYRRHREWFDLPHYVQRELLDADFS